MALMDIPPRRIFDSPCKGICRIDPQRGWCEGCFRTRSEIRDWPTASTTDKARILKLVEERAAAC
jgi:predicted Fe-S protein YdhL (DUF1289 family)